MVRWMRRGKGPASSGADDWMTRFDALTTHREQIELAAERITDWRGQAEADVPMVVRALVRAAISGSDTEPAPGRLLARSTIDGVLGADDPGLAGLVLFRTAELIYGHAWRPNAVGTAPAHVKLYLDNFIPPVMRAFRGPNGPTLADNLAELSETEAVWITALALVEASLSMESPTANT
jgi:hypothetical protein